MGKINSITKQTDNRYVNLYNVKATSVHNTPVNYFVSSRAKDVDSLKMVTHKNNPDGVIIYSIYGEKHAVHISPGKVRMHHAETLFIED